MKLALIVAIQALIGFGSLTIAASSVHAQSAAFTPSFTKHGATYSKTCGHLPDRHSDATGVSPVGLPAQQSSIYNADFGYTQVGAQGISGEYVVTGAIQNVPAPIVGWPVVLVYHGGGETAKEILTYSALDHLSAVVIALQGQPSHNGRSWMNAFPWLEASISQNLPRDDVRFTEIVLNDVANRFGNTYPLDLSRIYATGKSDGAGMAVFLAAHPELRRFKLSGVAPISGAYFGVNASYGAQRYTFPAIASDYQQIILASNPVPLLEMHGTDDTVMPYKPSKFTHSDASQFKNKKALDVYDSHGSFWAKRHGFADDQAYTADIPRYWQTWAEKVNGDDTKPTVRTFTAQSKLYIYSASGHLPLQHIAVEGGGHDWFGHRGKSPNASSPASLLVDATQIVADFFRIPLKGYQAPVVTPKLPYDSAAK